MVKLFSRSTETRGRAFNYLQSESYVKMPVRPDATYIPTSLSQEQAAKTNMASSIQVFSFMHS